tara:strand:- start:53676 stop:56804 length:3129 start_codon:yes stop_codon:yes gene_type:complete
MKKLLFLFICLLPIMKALGQSVDSYFQPMKFRNIGPFRGGRSVSASGVVGDPLTYYMGTTGGGLWKTANGGQQWDNISDGFFGMGSVGAVSVAASDPNIVYCGMGEHAPRGVMTSYGDGVYKSLDAGRTWKKMGLEGTQHISRIVIHPKDPNILLVAAQGALYGPNKDRGIYKSVDGGETWKNVLFVNELTGCAELSMDPNFPEILYAAMWEHQRLPNKVISGGEGSGLYKSTDGGNSWFKIHKGLPTELGKMAISVSPANSNKVYAVVESDSNKEQGGLFVSENAGSSWERISGDHRLVQRAWYYTEVFADPLDENTVYVLSAPALRSIDGGSTWETLSGTHGDYHDLWINPSNSKNMVIADDGGAAITFDYGKTWSQQNNMPTAQMYRIAVDSLFPYNIYGGQQDNTSLKIANMSLGRGEITEQDWTYSAGGESAFLAFDPNDPRYVLGGSYLGTIEVLDMQSKASTKIMAAPHQYLGREARDMEYLFNWNAPIIGSKHEPGTYYHCAQLVLRTRDMGITWEEVSPDLTRNMDEKQGKGGGPYTNEAVGAENYGTIAYMVESPHEKGVFWTGSDDGFVHITKNGGGSWENVTPKGLGESLVNAIEVSPHDPATAYLATTRYKFNDYVPALFKTTDYGKNWTNISSGIPYGSFTRVVREDPARKDLLYAGTEKGMYISYDGGKAWQSFQLNLPITPITDLMIHQGNLIVATSGRSFWILDDLNALQQYDTSKKGVRLLKPSQALNGSWGSPLSENSEGFDGTDPFNGVNPANGLVVYYELPKLADSLRISLEILDANGNVVNRFGSEKDTTYREYGGAPPPAPVIGKNEGLNRFVWDLRTETLPGIPDVYIEADFRGHMVPPGSYTLRLITPEQTVSERCTILEVPSYATDPGQYETFDVFMKEMEGNLTEMHQMVNRLFKMKNRIRTIIADLPKGPLQEKGQKLLGELEAWDNEMVQRKSKAYDDVENFPNRFSAEYLFLMNQTSSDIQRLNQPSRDRRITLDAKWNVLRERGIAFIELEIPNFNKELWAAGIGAIPMGY